MSLGRGPKNIEDLLISKPFNQLPNGFLHFRFTFLSLDVSNQIVDLDYAEDSELEGLRFEALFAELKPQYLLRSLCVFWRMDHCLDGNQRVLHLIDFLGSQKLEIFVLCFDDMCLDTV